MMVHILCVSLTACLPAGCGWLGFARRDIAVDLQAEDPAVRISAVHRAGREKLESAVPYLVDRLTDSERDVRMFTIVALEKITGLTHGYKHYQDAAARGLAVERWRRWLVDSSNPPVTTQPAGERNTE